MNLKFHIPTPVRMPHILRVSLKRPTKRITVKVPNGLRLATIGNKAYSGRKILHAIVWVMGVVISALMEEN